MAEWLNIIILALFQGVAEFLPISSSGHLALLGRIFGFDPETNELLNIVLHCGTLLAIAVFYIRRIVDMALLRRKRLLLLIIIGSLPAGIIGVVLKVCGAADKLFDSPLFIGCGFIITGFILFSLRRMPERADDAADPETISCRSAFLIGCAQALAILPGISRCGSTIVAGRKLKLNGAAAAEFSFLLALAAIGGASLLKAASLLKSGDPVPLAPLPLTAALAAAAVTGYFSLRLLLRLLESGKLYFFAYYLWLIGTSVVVYYGIFA